MVPAVRGDHLTNRSLVAILLEYRVRLSGSRSAHFEAHIGLPSARRLADRIEAPLLAAKPPGTQPEGFSFRMEQALTVS